MFVAAQAFRLAEIAGRTPVRFRIPDIRDRRLLAANGQSHRRHQGPRYAGEGGIPGLTSALAVEDHWWHQGKSASYRQLVKLPATGTNSFAL